MKKNTIKSGLMQQSRRWARKELPAAIAGSAIFLIGGVGAAQAQNAEPENLDEIVVNGIRKSIQDAIGVKKNETSIVEVISAEDIGKLPDSSIAESIGRLPGIAAQRHNGRAQTLSIRGMGPDFTVTTFNGREQATTNDNRTVEFDQYPSELVTQVKVYKTPAAGMAYQGIAGTTDVSTVHPLAYSERKTAITYRRERNGQEANIPGLPTEGNRVNLTYIDQFANDTLGVAFGFAYNKTPYQAQTREPWGYADAPGGDKVVGGEKDGVQSSFYKRTGYLGVVEYRPNEKLHMLLDAFHSDFNELQTIQRMEYGTIWAGATLTDAGPVDRGRVQSGTFPDIPFVVIENYNNDRHATIDSIGLKSEFAINENWSLANDISWSHVKRDDLRVESTGGNGTRNDPGFLPIPDSVSFTTDSLGITHYGPTANDYSNYDTTFLTDPGAWGGGRRRSGYVGHPEINDDIKALRLSTTRNLEGFFGGVTVGANYAERTKEKDNWQSILYLPGDISHAVVPEAYRTGAASTAFFGSPTGMISYDAIGLFRSGFWQPVDSLVDPNSGLGDRQSAVTNTWEVRENLTTAFVSFSIDSEIGGLPLLGDIGVQSITADQESDIGFSSGLIDGTTELNRSVVTRGAKYTEVLPSMNLALELPHDMKVRFGAAITQARPRMDELAGGAGYTALNDDVQPGNGPDGQPIYWSRSGGGNPELKPWKANTFDLSFEKYFNDSQGYVSLAAYYKKLTRFIFDRQILTSFDGVLLPDQRTPDDPTVNYTNADANRLGLSRVKVNGTGGFIRGFELTASLPLSMVSSKLDGLGVILSGANNTSEIERDGVVTPIPGMSTHVFNTTLYFEKAGFSARVSNRSRGEFIGEVLDFASNLVLNRVEAESLVDAQIGYEFREGRFKGLSVSITGTNLTDEPFQKRNIGDETYNFNMYQEYGANYSAALTYRF